MNNDRKFQVSVATFLLVVFALSYYIIQSGQEDSYTVLYFSNPTEPIVYSPDSNTLLVDFIIENHENQDMSYTYSINVNDSEMVKKDVTLKSDDAVSFSEDVITKELGETINISVQLHKKGRNEIYRQIWYQTQR